MVRSVDPGPSPSWSLRKGSVIRSAHFYARARDATSLTSRGVAQKPGAKPANRREGRHTSYGASASHSAGCKEENTVDVDGTVVAASVDGVIDMKNPVTLFIGVIALALAFASPVGAQRGHGRARGHRPRVVVVVPAPRPPVVVIVPLVPVPIVVLHP